MLALPNHGGKPMKNETLFRLTDVRRNSLFERTTPSKEFSTTQKLFVHFVRSPIYWGRTTGGYAVRFAHPNCAFGTTLHTPRPLYVMLKEVNYYDSS